MRYNFKEIKDKCSDQFTDGSSLEVISLVSFFSFSGAWLIITIAFTNYLN